MSTAQPAAESGVARWLLSATSGVRLAWALATLSRIANQLLLVAALVCAGLALVIGSLQPWLFWILGLLLVKAVLRYAEHFFGHWVAFTMLTRLRTSFYQALVPQAPAVLHRESAADLSEQATADIDRIEVFFAHTVPPALAAAVVPTASIAWVGVRLGWACAAALAVGAVVMLLVPLVLRRLARSPDQSGAATQTSVRAQIAMHLGDTATGLAEVTTFGAAEQRQAELSALETRLAAAGRRIRVLAGVRAAVMMLAQLGVLVALVAVAAASPASPLPAVGTELPVAELLPSGVAGGSGAVGAVLAALVWVGLWAPLRGVDDFVDGLDQALAAAARVRATMAAPPALADPPSLTGPDPAPAAPVSDAAATSASRDTPIPSAPGAGTSGSSSPVGGPILAAEDLTFTYVAAGPEAEPSTARPALTDVTLAVSPGAWTSIVGVSGSGKSTLAALLARGMDPSAGRVYFRGRDIAQLPLTELRSQVALVVQRPYLLGGSLAENLRLSAPGASEERLWSALRQVDLAGWARQLSGGLAYQILPDGVNLSGGQVQRVAIARALLARPAVLVLDEATSQLDQATSQLVRERIRAANPVLTVLEISHQVDRVSPDQPVVVVDAGAVVETGIAGDLLTDSVSALSRLAAR